MSIFGTALSYMPQSRIGSPDTTIDLGDSSFRPLSSDLQTSCGDVHRGCQGLKLKRDSRADSLVGSEDSNFARGPFPA
jgi:hypothetical protein